MDWRAGDPIEINIPNQGGWLPARIGAIDLDKNTVSGMYDDGDTFHARLSDLDTAPHRFRRPTQAAEPPIVYYVLRSCAGHLTHLCGRWGLERDAVRMPSLDDARAVRAQIARVCPHAIDLEIRRVTVTSEVVS